MRIAINTRFLLHGQLEGIGNFIFEHFSRITRDHPEHEFIFIFDRPYDRRYIFSPNVTAVVTGPPARHPLLWKLWFDVKIPAVLKKYKADVFVSCDGFCSLTTKVPQCLVVHDLSFLHFSSLIPKTQLLYYKYYTPRFLKTATSIVTVSEFSSNDIIKQYHINPGKIHIVHNAARSVFRELNSDEKMKVKEKYSLGREYFLYTGSIHPRKNLITLLKAFSIFKRRQKSNWKLILAGRLAWKNNDFLKSLKTYKYREDVILTGYVEDEELARLTGAAYALVYPSIWEGFGMPVLEAMKSNVPVITSKNSAMQEVANDAALYFDPGSHQELSEQMMLIYKDEQLRSKLMAAGLERSHEFMWEKSAEKLWDAIAICTQ